MAGRRMLHNTVSTSEKVNTLDKDGIIIFVFMISHADDDGRLKGSAKSVKAVVVPMLEITESEIEKQLEEMARRALIRRYAVANQQYIDFPKWLEFQQIRKSRYKPSLLPSFNDCQLSSNVQPNVIQSTTQYNLIKSNEIENNKNISKDNDDTKKLSYINPKTFKPSNEVENCALTIWRLMEPKKPWTFQSTYLKPAHDGLPISMFIEFSKEILSMGEDIENRGAMFNLKVSQYLGTKIKKYV